MIATTPFPEELLGNFQNGRIFTIDIISTGDV